MWEDAIVACRRGYTAPCVLVLYRLFSPCLISMIYLHELHFFPVYLSTQVPNPQINKDIGYTKAGHHMSGGTDTEYVCQISANFLDTYPRKRE